MKCINNITRFKEYKQYNISIKHTPIINTVLAQKNIIIRLKLPIEIKNKESIKTINDFTADHKIRIKYILSTAQKISDNKRFNMDYMHQTGLNYEVFSFPPDYQVIVIQDNESVLFNMPYNFAFAVPIIPTELK